MSDIEKVTESATGLTQPPATNPVPSPGPIGDINAAIQTVREGWRAVEVEIPESVIRALHEVRVWDVAIDFPEMARELIETTCTPSNLFDYWLGAHGADQVEIEMRQVIARWLPSTAYAVRRTLKSLADEVDETEDLSGEIAAELWIQCHSLAAFRSALHAEVMRRAGHYPVEFAVDIVFWRDRADDVEKADVERVARELGLVLPADWSKRYLRSTTAATQPDRRRRNESRMRGWYLERTAREHPSMRATHEAELPACDGPRLLTR